jgi:uncharacterized protein YdbL (DUF1318 family)
MNKHDLLINLAVERARLFQELLGVSASDLGSAHVYGDWSPRDVLAHIIAWERYACDTVRYLRVRQPVPASPETSDEDAYNARAVAVWRTKPLPELLDTLAIAHRQLTVAVAGCSQAQLDSAPSSGTGGENIVGQVMSIVQHDAEHTAQIRAWRKSRPDQVGPKVLLQHALNTGRAALTTLMDIVPAGQRESLPVTGEWMLKDVVGHIADWDEVIVEATLAMEANQPIKWEATDYGEGWNQSHVAARRAQPWAHVWQNFIDVRGTVVTELAERVMEPDLGRMLPSPWSGEMSFYVCLAIPCRHDMEHVEALLAWHTSQSN